MKRGSLWSDGPRDGSFAAESNLASKMLSLRTYSYLCQSRAIVLDRVRPLSDEQYRRVFPIGLGSLAKILTHTMTGEWYYIQRMLHREVPPDDTWPIQESNPPPFGVVEAAWKKQGDETRAAIASIRDWDAPFEYRVATDAGVNQIVTCSAADLFTQLAFHEVHHRAQVINMLRQLGVTIDRDIDFNAMMYPRRPA